MQVPVNPFARLAAFPTPNPAFDDQLGRYLATAIEECPTTDAAPAGDALLWWHTEGRQRYLALVSMALDYLSIPGELCPSVGRAQLTVL